MANFLVAGGAGFIGSNIVEELLKQGHFVRVLDNFFSGKEENLVCADGLGADKYELIKGDIRDKEDADKACKGMDYVLLLAALRSVPRSMAYPEEYNDVNINGILNMLQASSKNNIKRFVFSSSSSVYGEADQFPLQEHLFPNLISPYALSKLAGEYYCKIFSKFHGVECACLRYFNVFGPRQGLDDDYAVVIPKFIKCLLNDENPPIFGNGEQSRDFTFVENVVQANILAATTPGFTYEVFNIAKGEENSVLKLAHVLSDILEKNIEPKLLPEREGDIFRTFADISKARNILGYDPQVGFEEGLQETVKYFKTVF